MKREKRGYEMIEESKSNGSRSFPDIRTGR